MTEILGESAITDLSTIRQWGVYRRAFAALEITRHEDFVMLRYKDFEEVLIDTHRKATKEERDGGDPEWIDEKRNLSISERRKL